MPIWDTGLDDPLGDFARTSVDVHGERKTVYVTGSAGGHPDARDARHQPRPRQVRTLDTRRRLPRVPAVPFGRDGAYPTTREGEDVVRRACVSAEFRAFAGGGTSPVVDWLRGLARIAHAECAGPGVGAIGLCFTGNFALTMALEPAVIAPVLNHPSLPLDDPAGLEIGAEDAAAVAERVRRDGLKVLAYRFQNDRWCTGRRFAAYRTLLGDAFDGRVLADEAANPDPPPFFRDVVGCAHSVVTAHLVDEEGHPTLRARDEIIAQLTERLRPLPIPGGPNP